jgi:hypothetical protein
LKSVIDGRELIMRKTAIKIVLGMLVLAMLIVAVVPLLEATTRTQSYSSDNKVTVSGFGYFYRFDDTFKAMGDTVKIILPPIKPTDLVGPDTTMFRVNVYTSDTIYISVRYEVSSDNVNWKSYTIGTDSTTWAWGTAVAPTRTLNSFIISGPQYSGAQPYQRLKIFGFPPTRGRVTGYTGKLRVDVIPTKQGIV